MGAATTEEAHEELGEVSVDGLEGGQEPLATLAVEARDALTQTGDGRHQITALVVHAGNLKIEFLNLGLGAQVDRTDVVAFPLQALQLGLHLFARGQALLRIDAGGLQHLIETAV